MDINSYTEKLLNDEQQFQSHLDLVIKPINKIINYRSDYPDLIAKAIKISNGKSLDALKYIVLCLAHEGCDVEFELAITIPANTTANICLPIHETSPKDKLGYYVNWGNKITHNKNSYKFEAIDKIKEHRIKFFGLGISRFGEHRGGFLSYFKKYKDFAEYLTGVISFGKLGHIFTSFAYAFYNCKNNFSLPAEYPSTITDIRGMFYGCINFNQPLATLNTSNVTDLSCTFYNCHKFNQSLNSWDISKVINMTHTFYNCYEFNQSLNSWDTSRVIDMTYTFYNCTEFNQPLHKWNVFKVTDMRDMFHNCKNFNQSLNTWNTSNVTNMMCMFMGCQNFNGALANWNTSNVRYMLCMFYCCNSFNQYIANWNVYKVVTMAFMFYGCTNFNQPLQDWNIYHVRHMEAMFNECINFNQPLHTWTVYCSDLGDITDMFANCNISIKNRPNYRIYRHAYDAYNELNRGHQNKNKNNGCIIS